MGYVIVSLAILNAAFLAGQESQPAPAAQGQSEQDKALAEKRKLVAQPPPLTVREKYRYTLQRSFGAQEMVVMTAGAGLDQWDRHPDEWGEGWDAFGVRVASHFGQNLVKQHIAFGVRAIDHEDPRFVLSHRKGIWPRVQAAIIHTYYVRNDNGRMMPAYSRFISDYGATFISRQWWPERFRTVQEGFRGGTVSLGLDAVYNVAREFLPDIKKKLHH